MANRALRHEPSKLGLTRSRPEEIGTQRRRKSPQRRQQDDRRRLMGEQGAATAIAESIRRGRSPNIREVRKQFGGDVGEGETPYMKYSRAVREQQGEAGAHKEKMAGFKQRARQRSREEQSYLRKVATSDRARKQAQGTYQRGARTAMPGQAKVMESGGRATREMAESFRTRAAKGYRGDVTRRAGAIESKGKEKYQQMLQKLPASVWGEQGIKTDPTGEVTALTSKEEATKTGAQTDLQQALEQARSLQQLAGGVMGQTEQGIARDFGPTPQPQPQAWAGQPNAMMQEAMRRWSAGDPAGFSAWHTQAQQLAGQVGGLPGAPPPYTPAYTPPAPQGPVQPAPAGQAQYTPPMPQPATQPQMNMQQLEAERAKLFAQGPQFSQPIQPAAEAGGGILGTPTLTPEQKMKMGMWEKDFGLRQQEVDTARDATLAATRQVPKLGPDEISEVAGLVANIPEPSPGWFEGGGVIQSQMVHTKKIQNFLSGVSAALSELQGRPTSPALIREFMGKLRQKGGWNSLDGASKSLIDNYSLQAEQGRL